MDGSDPIRPRQWRSLRVRNGNQVHLAELLIDGNEVREIETAVKSGNSTDFLFPPRDRKVQIIHVEVHNVKLGRLLSYPFDHPHMVSQRVKDFLASQAQSSLANRMQLGVCDRVTACEKCYVVSLLNQFIG
jgi:hypothetical protein